jgi:hypothetical protein
MAKKLPPGRQTAKMQREAERRAKMAMKSAEAKRQRKRQRNLEIKAQQFNQGVQ